MKIANKMKFLASIVSISLAAFSLAFTSQAYAATSPTLVGSASYSVLGHTTVTCTGATNITGNVGVSTGTSITGFSEPCTVSPGTLESNTPSAINAQADNLSAFGALNAGENADANCIGGILADNTDLTTHFPDGVGPGLYCSAGTFLLTGNLNLTGSGVWIFKTVSGLTTSSGSSVTGGDACNVWWRVGSSATLETTTHFIGNILALTSTWLRNGATLNGRAMVQTGEVTLDANAISGPICAAVPTTTPAPTPAGNGFGLPGDNRSDNQSDHRSDNRSSTPQPSNVLGASTSTLAATGSSDQSVRIMLAVTAALSVFLLGKVLLRANKTS